jgi:hypothetical protein
MLLAQGHQPPHGFRAAFPKVPRPARLTRQTINLVSRLRGRQFVKFDHLDQTKDLAPAGPSNRQNSGHQTRQSRRLSKSNIGEPAHKKGAFDAFDAFSALFFGNRQTIPRADDPCGFI